MTLPGVKRVRASYKKQQMEVEYDEATVSAAQIVAAIQRLGYTVARPRLTAGTQMKHR